MTNTKNNLLLYAEEITVDQTTEQIQEIFNKLQQLSPTNFVELGQPKKYWGSTEGWKEPVCERYSFKHDNKLITLDIIQELSNKLELNPEKNFYVARELLNRDEKEEVIITIKNEEEIFIKGAFTINNLASTLQRWLTEIKTLKEQNQKLTEEKKEKQETIINLQAERNNLINQTTTSQSQIINLKDWKNQVKFNLVPLFWPEAFYTEDTPNVEIVVNEVKKLFLEKEKMENERNEYNRIEEELKQNRELIQKHLERINVLEGEKDNLKRGNEKQKEGLNQKGKEIIRLKNEIEGLKDSLQKWTKKFQNQTPEQVQEKVVTLTNERDNRPTQEQLNNLQQELAQKNDEIIILKKKVEDLETKLNSRPSITLDQWNNDYVNRPTRQELIATQQELKKEKGWWDKWSLKIGEETDGDVAFRKMLNNSDIKVKNLILEMRVFDAPEGEISIGYRCRSLFGTPRRPSLPLTEAGFKDFKKIFILTAEYCKKKV